MVLKLQLSNFGVEEKHAYIQTIDELTPVSPSRYREGTRKGPWKQEGATGHEEGYPSTMGGFKKC